jgi:hypothetical protein
MVDASARKLLLKLAGPAAALLAAPLSLALVVLLLPAVPLVPLAVSLASGAGGGRSVKLRETVLLALRAGRLVSVLPVLLVGGGALAAGGGRRRGQLARRGLASSRRASPASAATPQRASAQVTHA